MENCNYRNQNYRNRMQNTCQNNVCQNNTCQSNLCQNNPCQNSAPCQNKNCMRDGLDGMPLGMAYVPWQHWKETYEPCKALREGTLFPELCLPFLERSCGR